MKKYLLAIESAASGSSIAVLEIHGTASDEGVQWTEVTETWIAHNQSKALDHAEQLLPMLDGLLAEAAIDKRDFVAVAFSQGPGAFTGLRIACGLAQGIALGLSLPVIPIDSLRATAQLGLDHLIANQQLEVPNPESVEVTFKRGRVDDIVTLLDARMGEVYFAVYTPYWVENDSEQVQPQLRVVQKPSLIAVKDVLNWLDRQRRFDGRQLFFCGNALAVYEQELAASFETKSYDFTVLNDDLIDWADALVLGRLAFSKWQRGEVMEAHLAAPIYLREKVAFTESERAAGLSGNPAAAVPHATPQSTELHEQAREPQLVQVGGRSYTIRPMREDDIDAALAIEQSVQDYPWTRGNFKDSLQAAYPSWVVESQEASATDATTKRIVAFAVQMIAPDVAHLLLIAVAPSLHSQGLGSALLEHIETYAWQCGIDKQILEVRRSNQQAQAFYLRHRYAVIGTRKGYYREVGGSSEDAIVLEKHLTLTAEESASESDNVGERG